MKWIFHLSISCKSAVNHKSVNASLRILWRSHQFQCLATSLNPVTVCRWRHIPVLVVNCVCTYTVTMLLSLFLIDSRIWWQAFIKILHLYMDVYALANKLRNWLGASPPPHSDTNGAASLRTCCRNVITMCIDTFWWRKPFCSVICLHAYRHKRCMLPSYHSSRDSKKNKRQTS